MPAFSQLAFRRFHAHLCYIAAGRFARGRQGAAGEGARACAPSVSGWPLGRRLPPSIAGPMPDFTLADEDTVMPCRDWRADELGAFWLILPWRLDDRRWLMLRAAVISRRCYAALMPMLTAFAVYSRSTSLHKEPRGA